MISRDFVRRWEPCFDNQKYPMDFYLRHSDSARNAEQPEQLKENLLALLHWKDGKAVGFIPEKNLAKPNTLNPLLKLTDTSLKTFAQIFQNLVKADEKNVMEFAEDFRKTLNNMWSTVVIPAFLLNVARPERMPIIDQHTVRAFLALTCGEVVEKPKITWDHWRKYVQFFQTVVMASGYNRTLEERCYVDRALFAWGKSLKDTFGLKVHRKTPRPPKSHFIDDPKMKSPIFWGQQIPKQGLVPPSCDVPKALEEYLAVGSFDTLPQYKKQNLRDLQFHRFPQALLRELLQEPVGKAARELLDHYKEDMDGKVDLRRLPRPILDVFLVGWTTCCGKNRATQKANHLHKSGFGGTKNASMAIVTVGKTTGLLFGLLDKSGTPTRLFHFYFGV